MGGAKDDMRAMLHNKTLIIQADDDYTERIYLQNLYKLGTITFKDFGHDVQVTFSYCKETKSLEIKKEDIRE